MKPQEQAVLARRAGLRLAGATIETRNRCLLRIAEDLQAQQAEILKANKLDVEAARDADLKGPLLKRLELSESKILQMARGLEDLAAQADPLGSVQRETELDEGLVLQQVSVPIGLIGIIFESRPDAMVQISGLCLKSGNAVILKGGSEAAGTNAVLYRIIVEAVRSVDPEVAQAVQQVASREDIAALLELDDLIDLMIPRGSGELVKTIQENTRIPVLGHTEGVCHLYVDRAADLDLAVNLTYDSKCEYPAVCNAIETLLVHREIASEFLPRMAERLAEVELRGDSASRLVAPSMKPASEQDWRTEYNDLILSVRVVDSFEDAVEHINNWGSHHTDSIVTTDSQTAEAFMAGIDSSSVMWNCSTRFADGFRYGLGAEVGISTNKIHARGPVGLDGLTIYKFRLVGQGHCVAPYSSGQRQFTHKTLKS